MQVDSAATEAPVAPPMRGMLAGLDPLPQVALDLVAQALAEKNQARKGKPPMDPLDRYRSALKGFSSSQLATFRQLMMLGDLSHTQASVYRVAAWKFFRSVRGESE